MPYKDLGPNVSQDPQAISPGGGQYSADDHSWESVVIQQEKPVTDKFKCTKCEEYRELNEFRRRKKCHNGRNPMCKSCCDLQIKQTRLKKQDLYKKIRKQVRCRKTANNKAFLRSLKDRPCLDCGNSFPYYCMEFDHRDPSSKIQNVSRITKSTTKLFSEINKCDIICVLCHRQREFNRSGFSELEQRKKKTTFEIIRKMKDNPCVDCGNKYYQWQMEFDHISSKETEISNLMWRGSIQSLLDELLKCELVCAICHRKRSFTRRFEVAS